MCFLCFLPSYWLDQSQSLSVCLAKSWALSRGKARRQMNTHTHIYTHSHINRHTHARRPVPRQPHRNQVIEQSLYPGIPDITERQKICMKRETPYWAPLRLCVCVCVHAWCECVFAPTQHCDTLNGNQVLVSFSLYLPLIDPNSGVGLDCLPASQRAYKWIYHHSHLFIPAILLGMSLAWLCNEHVLSRVLF